MTHARSRVMLILEAAIVLQVGHQVEHIAQMVQMHLDGQPPAFAHGLVGRLDLEWVHFALTVTIALVALIVLARWPRNPVAWLLMPLALWHLAEHTAILITYLRTGITGTPGILAHGGLLNGPLARPDLHFLYNAAILLLLIGVWAWGYSRVRRRAGWITACRCRRRSTPRRRDRCCIFGPASMPARSCCGAR